MKHLIWLYLLLASWAVADSTCPCARNSPYWYGFYDHVYTCQQNNRTCAGLPATPDWEVDAYTCYNVNLPSTPVPCNYSYCTNMCGPQLSSAAKACPRKPETYAERWAKIAGKLRMAMWVH